MGDALEHTRKSWHARQFSGTGFYTAEPNPAMEGDIILVANVPYEEATALTKKLNDIRSFFGTRFDLNVAQQMIEENKTVEIWDWVKKQDKVIK